MKNVNPSGLAALSSSMRARGCPSASAVAKTIAFGSLISAATASANQRLNCDDRIGVDVGGIESGQRVTATQGGQRNGVHGSILTADYQQDRPSG